MNENKLKHSIAVARKMVEIAKEYNLSDEELSNCFLIGYLHDVGYELAPDGRNHNKVGGEWLKKSGFKFWREVYYHGEVNPNYQSIYLDILNMADMQIDGLGNDVGYEGRLEDIKNRYKKYPKVYQDCCKIVETLKEKESSISSQAGKLGILFDLDGTLWEVIDSTFQSANEITKKYHLPEISKETVLKVFGLNKREAAKLYFPDLPFKKSSKLLDEMARLNIEYLTKYGGNLYPNLENTLQKLNKYSLFIVSNSAEAKYIEAFLISSNLKDYFKDYIAASSLNISKEEAILKIIEKYHLEKAVYIGDTKKDLEAATQAGIPFIQAKYGFGEDLKTKYSISSFNALPIVLEQVFNKTKDEN